MDKSNMVIDRMEGLEDGSPTSDTESGMHQPLLLKIRRNNTSQFAIVGSNSCPIESLDYEIIENDLFKQDWRCRRKVEIFEYVFLKWTLALLIGLSTGIVGFLNNLAVENIVGFKLLLTNNLMSQQKYYHAFAVFGSCNLALAVAAGAFCAFIAPAAAGSGIPEVKAYLNGVDAHSILAPATLFVKIFGSILGVSAGFVVGKEGPMVHTGACIANLLGQGAIYSLGIITYGIAVPSGLFIPVILAGASYGRLLGTFFHSFTNLDVGFFGLLGAASFLGGTMRMTVSLCVILLELTNDLLMLPLIMLVLLISKTVADCFNKGVYDQIVEMKGLPYMEAHAEPYMRSLVAGDVVSAPLISFSDVEKVETMVQVLRETRHNGFPVIDEEAAELCGLVLRSHLLVLLKAKSFTRERARSGTRILRRFKAHDFAKAGLGKGVRLEDLEFTREEMEMYIDLRPITNTSPYTVVDTMSLAKAALLFRELALRHLCVVPKTQRKPPILGILTRHDFTPEHIWDLYPHLRGNN